MKFHAWLPLLIALLSSNAWARAGGDGTRGGGNAILCDDGKVYAWDYLQRDEHSLPINLNLVQLESAREILGYVSAQLARVNRPMHEALEEFRKIRQGFPSGVDRYVWVPASNPLIPVGDETRIQIPRTCRADAAGDTPLIQAVIRMPKKVVVDGQVVNRRIFYFDPDAVRTLEQNSPAQLAYLYLHEWLRDYTSDSDLLPHAVQYLMFLEDVNPATFRKHLEGLGLKLPADSGPSGSNSSGKGSL